MVVQGSVCHSGKKGSMKKKVPYSNNPLGICSKTMMRGCRLPSGATVRVGYQDEHPESKSGGYLHILEMPKPDGTVTQLRFSLTPEACYALMILYAAHGVKSGPGVEPLTVEELKLLRKGDDQMKGDQKG